MTRSPSRWPAFIGKISRIYRRQDQQQDQPHLLGAESAVACEHANFEESVKLYRLSNAERILHPESCGECGSATPTPRDTHEHTILTYNVPTPPPSVLAL